MKIHNGLLPMYLRGQTDLSVYREVIVNDEYRIAEYAKSGVVPNLVFDFGANVGSFTRLVVHKWPGVRVVAVEADRDNAEVLQRNVDLIRSETPDADVCVVRAALMPGVSQATVYASRHRPETTASRFCLPQPEGSVPVRIVDGDGSAYPFGSYVAVGSIETTSVAALVAAYGVPDLMKFDCEGGEVAWLAHDDEAFPTCRIVGEWHYREGRAAFLSLLCKRYPSANVELRDNHGGPNRGLFDVLIPST